MPRLILTLLICASAFAVSSAEDLSQDEQLVDACYRLNEFRAVQLLRNGADVNATFRAAKYGGPIRKEWTPLLALANTKYKPEAKPGVYSTDSAVKRMAILRLLLSNGCDIDVADRSGLTALHTAIRARDAAFVEYLLLFDPNVNTSASDGHLGYETALHSAYWSPGITAALLAHGANADATDSEGRSASEARNWKLFSDFVHTHGRVPTQDECQGLDFRSPFDTHTENSHNNPMMPSGRRRVGQ